MNFVEKSVCFHVFPQTRANVFDIIQQPRKCNYYRAQVNTDFGQNTGGCVLYKCSGTYEVVHRLACRTSKRFTKYCTSEHCYNVSVQILFCVYSNQCYPDPPLRTILFSRSLPNFYRINFDEPREDSSRETKSSDPALKPASFPNPLRSNGGEFVPGIDLFYLTRLNHV